MAKSTNPPITANDLADFVNTNSDFGFEMKVLTRLQAEGFGCDHAGTYGDPVTGKIRQFDIRAVKDRSDCRLALAVECKNLRPNNPLLLSSVPRTAAEAFHDLLVYDPKANNRTHSIKRVSGSESAYRPGDMVGKRTDQVMRREQSGELVSNDEATFDKLNQAVSSCQELVRGLSGGGSPQLRRAIVPVLVVPTGLLWQVDYDPDGAIAKPPRQVRRTALFLSSSWSVPVGFGDLISYRLSHIEVVTFDALVGIAECWLGPEGFFPQ